MSDHTFQLDPSQQRLLLKLARDSIACGLQSGRALSPGKHGDPALQSPGACFVTLTLDGALRGCIGSLEAHRPLAVDVCENAFAAAFRDPRFPPLEAGEWESLHIEISVLGSLQEIIFHSEEELLRQIIPFKDGLLLEDRGRRGTFLPLVWEQLPDKKMFWTQLKRKAGLATDHWSDTLRCYRYHTFVFEE